MRERKETNYQQLHEQIIGDGTQSIQVVLGRLFMTLLLNTKLYGTTYLREAIAYRYERGLDSRVSLTKEIYPTVANNMSTTVNRVERNIRNTINDCYVHGNLFAFNTLTRSEVIKPHYVPTNGELINSIASWLILERQQNNIR